MSEELRKKAGQLAVELKNLLQENLLKSADLARSAMEKASKIRDEIQQMGFMVRWEANFDPADPTKIEVDVTLWMPKKDMPPEYQKKYDDWFAETNNIQPPQ